MLSGVLGRLLWALGVPGKSLSLFLCVAREALSGYFWGPWGILGVPWGLLGDPCGARGGPLEALGQPLGADGLPSETTLGD